jgi:transcriptional regulator with XRE-family HTH domain
LATAADALAAAGYPISRKTIGAWETGRNVPDALWLRRLAKIYDTTVDNLVGRDAAMAWPFMTISRDRFLTLDPGQLLKLEGRLEEILDALPPPAKPEGLKLTRPNGQRNRKAA